MDVLLKILPFAILLMGAYGTYTDFESHEERIESLRGQINAKKMQNKRLKKKVDEVKDFIPQINSVEKAIADFENQIKEIKFKIPPLKVKTDILDELSVDAKKLNIQQVSFKPSYEIENSGGIYFTNALEFQAEGTYLQFLIFFEKLSLAERVFNIKKIKIEDKAKRKSGRHKLILANAIIETFHYNENYQEKKEDLKGGKKK